MDLTINTLRDTLEHRELQPPDILFRFEHTAFPVHVTRRYPKDYPQFRWNELKERKLTSITAGFSAKGEALCNGFQPVGFKPPLDDAIHQIRLIRFIPDSGEISVETIIGQSPELDDWAISCKMKSAIVVAKIGTIAEVEREICIEEHFGLQVTLPQRKIEFS